MEPTKNNSQQQPANPLDKPVDANLKPIELIYDVKDKEYLAWKQMRLESAKNQKNQIYQEYNWKNYYAIYEEDEKIANTVLEGKKNDDDVIVSAGTVESKLDSLLANINNLDLSPQIMAYDKDNNLINELGVAIQDTIFMTEENDGGDEGGDEEKKMMRQRELLKHGTAFVQEEWLRRFETRKVLKDKYDKNIIAGQFFSEEARWDEKLELVFEGPARTLIDGRNMFLGNITEFFMDKQPFIFTYAIMDFEVAKAKYGKFDRFKYVKKGNVPSNINNEDRTIYNNQWRLTTMADNQVGVLIYQDKTRDEFSININGVELLPIGFPLSAVSAGGGYNITKQVYRIINNKFAYGKSFVSSGSVKEISALIDEMLKLFVLKTRKSFTPAYINTSGRVISKRVLSPGRISMGIPPDALHKIGDEGQGVTSNEFAVLKELQDRIDKSTVSNIFQGQQGKAGTTATEIVELQRQAKLTLGLTIAVCSLLEKKLAYLRLWNLLENWFNPIETKEVTIDGARKEIGVYRTTVREVNLDGEGMGQRKVIPTTDSTMFSADPNQQSTISQKIRDMERATEEAKGHPVRHIYLEPEQMKAARHRWYVNVLPKEKESSALYKLLFRDMLNDIIGLMQFGSKPNLDTLEDEFARVWGKSRTKLFTKGTPMQGMQMDPGMTGQGGVANAAGKPKLPVGAGA